MSTTVLRNDECNHSIHDVTTETISKNQHKPTRVTIEIKYSISKVHHEKSTDLV